jgi:host factor-I protein
MRGDNMAEKFNLQDRFLNILRINKIEVKIYLEGGFQTSGVVRSFDDYTVLLEKNGEQSLVYKHAIKMMAPSKYIKLFQEQSSKDE